MKRITFNRGWELQKDGVDDRQPVDLPHDAMLDERRDPDCTNAENTAWFPGGLYLYRKRFEAPATWAGKRVLVEFEGVYRNSTVEINGQPVGGHRYGYTNYFVDLTPHLTVGGDNELVVRVDNSKEPNSRWYTGSGLYRPVALWVGEAAHIPPQGLKIDAPAGDVTVTTQVVAPQKERCALRIEIRHEGRLVAEVDDAAEVQAVTIPDPKLWSAERPTLYTCRVVLSQDGEAVDEASADFGIRKVAWSADRGLLVNGAEVTLRGACVHHDSGILGAATFAVAEERRVRILKEAGFNAIRSSHNPASKAMLDACDRLGMYVMDEAFDQWYIPKTKHDYARDFDEHWRDDLRAMVEKDYNHPCVLMYSIGNEVSETAQARGIELTGEMVALLHELDPSRAVTAGINLMLNGLVSMGKGIYKEDDGAGEASSSERRKPPASGSAFFNALMNTVGTVMNYMGRLPFVDKATRGAFEKLDICGYNYGRGRYALEKRAYPDRVVVGSETFPHELHKNWQLVEKHPYLIGDFMWTGWDYLGEGGLGAVGYDRRGGAAKAYPYLTSDCGVIDITGHVRPEVFYNQAVWGLRHAPYIGVEPLTHAGEKRALTMWRKSDARASWSWAGCEGKKAEIRVYSDSHRVELRLNGKAVGQKRVKGCVAKFKTPYEKGELLAIAYDPQGTETGRCRLVSAGDPLQLTVKPETAQLKAGGEDLAYINIELTDENGVLEAGSDRRIHVEVEGAGTLQGLGSANPYTEEVFDKADHDTFFGRAQAIVRSGYEAGEIRVTVSADGLASQAITLQVQPPDAPPNPLHPVG